jgi:hypothetical protein
MSLSWCCQSLPSSRVFISVFHYNHMNSIRRCTCQSPPVIDLTDVLAGEADRTNQEIDACNILPNGDGATFR